MNLAAIAEPSATDPSPADAEATGTSRCCLATGEVADKATLIRFVAGPDGAVVPDVDGRLPGRGLWVKASRLALEAAIAKRLFSRAAKADLKTPADLASRTEALLARRLGEQLGLARRAGDVVNGFDKVADWLARGKAGLVLAAADGAADGRAKIARLAGDLPRVEALRGAELSLALGQGNVVHAAVARGPFAARIAREAARLAGFRTPPSGGNEIA